MLNFKSGIMYYLSSTASDMRKGREGLAGVVRESILEAKSKDGKSDQNLRLRAE